MDIFNYDKNTGEFLSQSVARQDPLNKDNFLIPANATPVSLPALSINEAAVFDAGNDKWNITPDYRGETYYLKSDGSEVIFDLGNEPDATMQKTFPAAIKLQNDKTARKSEIENEANELIDAQISNNPRKQLMMVAKAVNMLDAQVGRGGNPSRDPQQDQLVAIFNYVELVNSAEKIAIDAVDVASDPSTITLVHPPLPGS